MALKGFKVDWHTRHGGAALHLGLQRVAAGQARNVILLNPDDEEVLSPHPFQAQCTLLQGVLKRWPLHIPPFLNQIFMELRGVVEI